MGVYKIRVEQYSHKQTFKTYRFHNLIKHSVLLAQFFALLPVNGVTLEESKLEFKWLSFRTFYTVITGFLLLLYTACVLIYTVINSDNFFSFVVVVWNVRAILCTVLFFWISGRWSALIEFWKKVECSMRDYGPLPSLKLKFCILSLLYILTGAIEHTFFMIAGIKKLINTIKPSESYVQKYFELMYSEFFNTFEYAHWKAVLIEIENESDWRDIRQHYNSLTLLCKLVNDIIGQLVVLAFLGNLYFLSISVLQCLTPREGFDVAYYWYGLFFTIMHFLLLCWYASWVYEASSEPISELAGTPTKNLSHETDRLLHQMASRDAAISGCGLFEIKRSSILTIISTVVTIELIFLQFNTKLSSNI
ncbi:hypothetical protein RN001_008368 [Aquatica leii]|uniref:Gustatory receptor n=1 Tax=Aquatica leii TaxID=1421715 RepID=A0AAN7PZ37_9COLE|nr:hypothetical protein RN001_008368 [Aquatica leii]